MRIYTVLIAILLSCGNLMAQISKTEQAMKNQGLIDIHTLDPSIKVSLMYSRADNFTGKILYTDITHAYLHPKAARALARAQKILQQEHPNLSLIVFDATRPMSIQRTMWNVVKNTPQYFYVSNPARGGGMHNYGMAVDISICNTAGDTLTMGTKIDYMGAESHISNEKQLVLNKKITPQAAANRKLLRKVMQKAGFHPLATEWWHFNYVTRAVAKKYYKAIR